MNYDVEKEIRESAMILGLGIEFEDVVVLLSSRLPTEVAHLVARAGQLFLKYGA